MRYVLICLGLILLGKEGRGQWDAPVQLTFGDYYNGYPQILVDDSLRLHVFWVRSLSDISPRQLTSLFYQRFDNWGNPLTPPIELSPIPHFVDYGAGVLLDRNQNIHVVWSRTFDQPFRMQVLYLKMNTNGEILTGPIVVDTTTFIQSGINMAQDLDGFIWVVGDQYKMVVSENGEIVQTFQLVFPPETMMRCDGGIVRCSPDNKVWFCIRYFAPDHTQNIAVVRLDTTVYEPEILSPDTSQFGIQMNPQAFYIDTSNAFHYILYREDAALFYQRDARDGSPQETLGVDTSPFGDGSTFLTLVGGDTLVFLWGQTLPEGGYLRVGFNLSGERVISPIFTETHTFGLSFNYYFQWKNGGYWIIGYGGVSPSHEPQLSMIHVPGPNEPSNAVDDRQNLHPSSFSLSAYPNPFNPSTTLSFDLDKESFVKLVVFDITGREVKVLVDERKNAGEHRVQFDGSKLASGIYLARMELRPPFDSPPINRWGENSASARTIKMVLLK